MVPTGMPSSWSSLRTAARATPWGAPEARSSGVSTSVGE